MPRYDAMVSMNNRLRERAAGSSPVNDTTPAQPPHLHITSIKPKNAASRIWQENHMSLSVIIKLFEAAVFLVCGAILFRSAARGVRVTAPEGAALASLDLSQRPAILRVGKLLAVAVMLLGFGVGLAQGARRGEPYTFVQDYPSLISQFAALLLFVVALIRTGPKSPDGVTLRSLTVPQRGAVKRIGLGFCGSFGVWSSSLGVLISAAVDADHTRSTACDDTMFVATHPELPTGEASNAKELARRFVILTRELSATPQCNERSLVEAFALASHDAWGQAVMALAPDGPQAFLARRHTENVSVDIDSVESRNSSLWRVSWTEHVRTPAGLPLRRNAQSAELQIVSAPQAPHGLQVITFSMSPADGGKS